MHIFGSLVTHFNDISDAFFCQAPLGVYGTPKIDTNFLCNMQ